MKNFSRTNDPVLARSLCRHEAVVPGIGEVLPAWAAIFQSASLAIVSNVAVTRVAAEQERGTH